jgi:hypothetical protein
LKFTDCVASRELLSYVALKSQKRHKPVLGSPPSRNFPGWHPLDPQQSCGEQDQAVDFLLTRTRATPIQFIGSLIMGVGFITFAATIFLFVFTSTKFTRLGTLLVFLVACPISLLFCV